MSRRDALLGLLVAVVWGVNFVVIDEGLPGVPPLFFAAIRFTCVSLLTFVVARPKAHWRYVVGVGLFMSAGQFGLLYLALGAGMPSGLASLVVQAQVPLTILLASATNGERISRRQLVGLGVALLGLVIVAWGRGGHVALTGLVLVLAAGASWAVGNVLARRAGASGLSLVVWSAPVAPLPLLALSATLEGPSAWWTALQDWGWRQTASTAFTVLVATVVGFGIWNALLAKNATSRVVPFALLVPVAGLAAAWIVQGEQPAVPVIAGGVVLLAGAFVALTGGLRPAAVRSSRARSAGSAVPGAPPAKPD
ncbi:MAG TPA: EamA family transporter, partial [Pseudonocardiaceae bacterium]